jgi:four helix bundle protein
MAAVAGVAGDAVRMLEHCRGFWTLSADFARFLRISRGSLLEVQEHLEGSRQVGVVSEPEFSELTHLANRAIGVVTRLIRYLDRAKAP